MRFSSVRALLPSLVVVACMPLVAACNAVLGISEPSDTVLDDVHSPITGTSDSGVDSQLGEDSQAMDAASADAGAADASVVLPPSAFPRARWPMPNAVDAGLGHIQSFSAVADGVVRDTVTGLEWQVTADDEPRDFSAAAAFCDALDLAGGGFRLPSRIELTSLLDLSQASPALDTSVFPGAQADRFWSSSGYAGGVGYAWLVSFSFSTSHVISDLASELHLTRCVRSPAGGGDAAALVLTDDTVTDTATGLAWQRVASAQTVTIADAQSACAAASAEVAGFRLPSLKELHTLIAEDAFKPAVDVQAFPGCPAAAFWTQSHVPNFGEYTWTVSFGDGSDVWVAADAMAYVRCVREVR